MKKLRLLSIVMGLMLCTFATLQAQVTLSGTSYTENFDGISTALPTGWSVYKLATSSTIGTAVTLTTTATAWKNTAGGAFNYASADGFTIADTTNTTGQAASTDRALGYRQTGSNGDPGASFLLQIANTTGMSSFHLSFKFQSLDNAVTRVTKWKVQYAIGATPTTFTDLTTNFDSIYTGGNNWKNTDVEVTSTNFGTTIDNQADPIWIRIVALTASVGSGSRPVTAIDDVNLTWSTGAASTDATLSDLTTGGATVAGFASSTYTYNVVLPYGTTVVPTVTGIATNAAATVVVTPATSLPGATTVLVTAQDGATQQTYTINYTIAPASNVATLSDLTTGGATVTGFASGTYTYNVELPFGTTVVPTVTGIATDATATVAVTPAASLPGATTVLVTAQDGTMLTYTINYTVNATASTDATLSDLTTGGTTVTGFVSSTYTYNVVLPYGTTVVPATTATVTDATATFAITLATSLPGVTTVLVTAQDGIAQQTYTINYTLAAPSTVATLSDLTTGGTTVTGFASATLVYNVVLPYGTTVVPATTATVTDATATFAITLAASLPGATTVLVTAQDGIAQQTYTINYTLAAPSNVATLSDLTTGGTTVTGFASATLVYNVVLPVGTTVVPAVIGIATDPNATVVVTPATSLPGATTVVVTAQDGTTHQTYTINYTVAVQTYTVTFSVVGANGTLAATVDAAAITSPATVVAGKNVVFTAAPATNFVVKEWKLDGTVVAGNTTNNYTLSTLAANATVTVEFKSTVGINEAIENVASIYPNPANDVVNVKMNSTINKIAVVNMNGQVVMESLINNNEGLINTSTIANGMYFLRIETANGITMNKIQISK